MDSPNHFGFIEGQGINEKLFRTNFFKQHVTEQKVFLIVSSTTYQINQTCHPDGSYIFCKCAFNSGAIHDLLNHLFRVIALSKRCQ